jgi:GTP-binding protein
MTEMEHARELPLVVIVGRPNVGKSTIFNRLLGRRLAIVDELPGVTRDLVTAEAEWDGYRYMICDTGGIGRESQDPLQSLVAERAWDILERADLIIFVTDVKAGISEGEMELRRALVRLSKPMILAVNKVDGEKAEAQSAEFYKLGIEPLVAISAQAGRSFDDLLDAINEAIDLEKYPQAKVLRKAKGAPEIAEPAEEGPDIRLIVLGRQNVGKSSLVNALLSEDKVMVSELPGTTRDAITGSFSYEGRTFELTDTAGLKKITRMEDVDYYSYTRMDEAARTGEICLLVLDAERGIEEMDKRVAKLIEDHGRGVVITVNKWDLMAQGEESQDMYRTYVRKELVKLSWAPIVFTSAVEATGLEDLLDAVLTSWENFQRMLDPKALRDVIDEETTVYPPPVVKNQNLILRDVVQARTRPPTFVFTVSDPKLLRSAYRNFLENTLRKYFPLEGTHIRLFFRESETKARKRHSRT